MQHIDQLYGYSTIILASAPLATQLAICDIRWIFYFPIFAIPALTLMMTVGHLSKSAAVSTFRKLAPIFAGLGWALTWHVAEKLYSEGLRASQYVLYILFSIRTHLSWAVSCCHTYNSQYCHEFTDPNVTVTEGKHHYPENFWPAQEFNRYVIRRNQHFTSMPAKWEPNMWYLGPSDETFKWEFPALPLLTAHCLTWSIIYILISKYYDRLGEILLKVFLLIPMTLYITVIIGLTGFGFHFTTANIQVELDNAEIAKDPFDFWADLRGSFRTSILIVDYSTAFTGFVLLATSRLRSGVSGLNALLLVPFMMIVPTLQTLIRLGCEGHVADLQPNYKIYASTDETISFDLLPVCFATSHFGPVWSALYFSAQYLYGSLGPMLVYVIFIYQSFIDDFPIVQNSSKQCIGMMCLAFLMPSVFLYMPLGTKIAAFFRYTSQTAIVQITVYILIFFVYGWQKLEQDVLITASRPTLWQYFSRPTSPIFTFLLFTVVPALLCSKLVAVFDFLWGGMDVVKHVDAGVQFLPFPTVIRRTVGYLIMFAPLIILLVGAVLTVWQMVIKHGIPWRDTFKPSPEWMSHGSVNANKPRLHSLAHTVLNDLIFRRMSYKTGLTSLFLFEVFLGIVLAIMFLMNTSPIYIPSTQIANQYRSILLLIFVFGHVWALCDMRNAQRYAQIDGTKLSFYICLATMETAMLNAYMLMYATDHQWGIDWPPILTIFINTWIRGCCILVAIAIRANSLENNRPTNTREASEIDDTSEMTRGNLEVESGAVLGGGDYDDDVDDSPVIFDLAHV